jgi:hypothetical protein
MRIDNQTPGQITLSKCKEAIETISEAYHLYYKRTIQENGVDIKEYCYTENIEEALIDPLRYGSLFFRVGETNNWREQYQIIDEQTGEPI